MYKFTLVHRRAPDVVVADAPSRFPGKDKPGDKNHVDWLLSETPSSKADHTPDDEFCHPWGPKDKMPMCSLASDNPWSQDEGKEGYRNIYAQFLKHGTPGPTVLSEPGELIWPGGLPVGPIQTSNTSCPKALMNCTLVESHHGEWVRKQ
jgi:hypothetical protein